MPWPIIGICRNKIGSLKGAKGVVQDTRGIMRMASDYYKELLKWEDRGGFSLGENFWDPEDILSDKERNELEKQFSEEEIKFSVFSCYPEGAPGPDGLSFLFYHKFWEVVSKDVVAMFNDMFAHKLDLFRLNFSMLTLIPKIEDVDEMKSFRPISLLNYSFKIFSKVLTVRLERVSQRLVAKEQSAFIRGMYILESVVIAHEIVHSIHKSKDPGVILKLDYEKAYDRVNIDFLLDILETRGFGSRWIGWIRSVVVGGSMSVLVNGEESNTFKTGKGLRQGDPLSPLLFNLVTDVLTKMLAKATGKKLVEGLLGQFREGGILSLQYADDTLICEMSAIRNLKGALILFERIPEMRINFHKSELISLNLEDEIIHEIAHQLYCPIGSLPFKYQGCPYTLRN
jgi:hypothetical protein